MYNYERKLLCYLLTFLMVVAGLPIEALASYSGGGAATAGSSASAGTGGNAVGSYISFNPAITVHPVARNTYEIPASMSSVEGFQQMYSVGESTFSVMINSLYNRGKTEETFLTQQNFDTAVTFVQNGNGIGANNNIHAIAPTTGTGYYKMFPILDDATPGNKSTARYVAQSAAYSYNSVSSPPTKEQYINAAWDFYRKSLEAFAKEAAVRPVKGYYSTYSYDDKERSFSLNNMVRSGWLNGNVHGVNVSAEVNTMANYIIYHMTAKNASANINANFDSIMSLNSATKYPAFYNSLASINIPNKNGDTITMQRFVEQYQNIFPKPDDNAGYVAQVSRAIISNVTYAMFSELNKKGAPNGSKDSQEMVRFAGWTNSADIIPFDLNQGQGEEIADQHFLVMTSTVVAEYRRSGSVLVETQLMTFPGFLAMSTPSASGGALFKWLSYRINTNFSGLNNSVMQHIASNIYGLGGYASRGASGDWFVNTGFELNNYFANNNLRTSPNGSGNLAHLLNTSVVERNGFNANYQQWYNANLYKFGGGAIQNLMSQTGRGVGYTLFGWSYEGPLEQRSASGFTHRARPSERVFLLEAPTPIPQTRDFQVYLTIKPDTGYNDAFQNLEQATKMMERLTTRTSGPVTVQSITYNSHELQVFDIEPKDGKSEILNNPRETIPESEYEIFNVSGGEEYGTYESKSEVLTLTWNVTAEVNPGDSQIDFIWSPSFEIDESILELSITAEYEPEDENVEQQPNAYTHVKFIYEIVPEFSYVSSPLESPLSTKPMGEYVEIKQGSPYTGERFEAMAGVPTTEPMYVQFGGTEFIIAMKGKVKVGSMSRTISTSWTGYWFETDEECPKVKCEGHIRYDPPATEGGKPVEVKWSHDGFACCGANTFYNTCLVNAHHATPHTIDTDVTIIAEPYLYADIEELSSYRLIQATLNSPQGLFTQTQYNLNPNLGTYAYFSQTDYADGNGRIYFAQKLSGGTRADHWGNSHQEKVEGDGCNGKYLTIEVARNTGNEWTAGQWSTVIGEQEITLISDYYMAESSEGWHNAQYHVQELTETVTIRQKPGTGTSTENIKFEITPDSGYQGKGTVLFQFDTTQITDPQERLDLFWTKSDFLNAGKSEWLPEQMTRSGYNGQFATPATKMINRNIVDNTYQIMETRPEIRTLDQPHKFEISWPNMSMGKDFANIRLKANMNIINSTTPPYERAWSASDTVLPVQNGEHYTGQTQMVWNRDIWYGDEMQVRVDYSNGQQRRVLEPVYRKDTDRVNDIVIHNPVSVRYANVITNDKNTTDFRIDPPPPSIVGAPTKKEYICKDGHTHFTTLPTEVIQLMNSETRHDYKDRVMLPSGDIVPHVCNSPPRTVQLPPTDETFTFTGGIQTFKAPVSGNYTFELWGASGGGASPNATVSVPADTKYCWNGTIYDMDQAKACGNHICVYDGAGCNYWDGTCERYGWRCGGHAVPATNGPAGSQKGLGGRAIGSVNLTAGQTVNLYIGGQGTRATSLGTGGGWNGGGHGGPSGHGGGGATDVRIGGTDLSNRIIVAGGGGGADDIDTNVRGGHNDGSGGHGGGTSGGRYYVNGVQEGNVATQTSGTLGQGQNSTNNADSGGAGGGWRGGFVSNHNNGGGGGGSGYIGGVSNGSMQTGVREGNGMIRITGPGAVVNVPSTDCRTVNSYRVVENNPHQISFEEASQKGYSTSMYRIDNVASLNRVNSKPLLTVHAPNALKSGWQAPMTGNYVMEVVVNNQRYNLALYLRRGERVITDTSSTGSRSVNISVPSLNRTLTINNSGTQSGGNWPSASLNRATVTGVPNYRAIIYPTTNSVSLGVLADRHYPMPDPECWHEVDTGLPAVITIPGQNPVNVNDIHINIDHEFRIYYPSLGDFAQAPNLLGIPVTTDIRGKGYTNNMNIDRWIRNKFITLPVNVIDENGTMHLANMPFDVLKIRDDGNHYYEFYAVLNNHEQHQADVHWLTIGSNAPETEIVFNSELIENKTRDRTMKAARPASNKTTRIDVVGWLGNLKLRDTGDYRYANFFKHANENGWLIENLVKRVDPLSARQYLMDVVDIRQRPTNATNWWGNIHGTQEILSSDKHNTFPLEAGKNNIESLRQQQMRPGYKLYLDVETIGEYHGNNVDDSGNFQDALLYNRILIQPKYYAVNSQTGASTPIDAYQLNQGSFQKIYDFDYPEFKQTNYFEIFQWIAEQSRRSFGTAESTIQARLDAANYLYRYPIEDPKVLGTPNKVEAYDAARHFIGSTTTLGKNMNPGELLRETDYMNKHAKFYFNISLPSSVQFVQSNREPIKANFDSLLANYDSIVLKADIRATGDVYTLRYNGVPMNTNSLRIKGRSIPVPGDMMDPVIAVMELDRTAANDVQVQGSH